MAGASAAADAPAAVGTAALPAAAPTADAIDATDAVDSAIERPFLRPARSSGPAAYGMRSYAGSVRNSAKESASATSVKSATA